MFSLCSAGALHDAPMKTNATLIVMSLLSMVLSLIHVADDVVRGYDRFPNLLGMLIWVVWLYGTLVLPERRLGQIIMLLGGILSAGIPILHMRGGAAARIAATSGAFLFIGTLLFLGVTGTFSIVLAVRALLLSRRADAKMIAVAHESSDR